MAGILCQSQDKFFLLLCTSADNVLDRGQHWVGGAGLLDPPTNMPGSEEPNEGRYNQASVFPVSPSNGAKKATRVY